MTLQEIFDLGIQMAVKADPRGEKGVQKHLEKVKKEYEKTPDKKKKFFDKEDLKHPYADSRIYVGDGKKQIKKVLASIDVSSGGIVLAERLNQLGRGIDAVITHHPHGSGLAGLSEVMSMMVEIEHEHGVPLNVADAIAQERISEVGKRFKSIPNHNQTVDAARLLDIPLVSLHTVWDNLTWKYLTDYVAKKEYDTVEELFDDINEIPEFVEAQKYKAGPMISAGSPRSRTGKIIVDCTGGTNLGKEIYAELAKAGVGTVVQMHISEDEIKEMKKYHMNAIDTGHIPADSIGGNIFLDELEKKGIEVIPFGGLVRGKRN